MNKFWMVLTEGGNYPTVRHDNIIEAMREASRLAQKQERNAYVLECVGVVSCRKEIITKYEEIKHDTPCDA
jgi:hypothetical protein